ncbi:hypothetical protein B0T24DRAFT_621046 [Lasiosphaeria ovina]|uniref:Rhodopsin domain-containing protein n=1 Tax=Lasiosphaeria ovina TaxID=92902 RepID=A0AAE0KJW8_9PEZI|nr:hypothetical protein B0T24DRAFT_621046 [Lasiosphaeria ovina]
MTTDIFNLSLPWFIFRSLNLSKRRKIELLLVCSVGVFTLVSSIVRLPHLHNLNQSKDPTWDVVDICIWSITELGSAITLSSVPAIRPLFAHIFPKVMGSARSSKDASSNQLPSSGHPPDQKGPPFCWLGDDERQPEQQPSTMVFVHGAGRH